MMVRVMSSSTWLEPVPVHKPPAGGIVRTVMSTRSTRTGARATTSAEAALRFADELAHACAGALGKTVAGVILHGSLTLDDYVPGRSDLDLLVVIDDPGAANGGLPAPHPQLRGPAGGAPEPRRARPGSGALGVPRARPQPAGCGAGRADRRDLGPVGGSRRRRAAGRLAGDRGRPA